MGPEPRDTDIDDFTEREAASECANRAVLEVLEGARIVEAAYECAAGVECIGEAICISSSLLCSRIVSGSAESSKAGRDGKDGMSLS